MAINVNEVIDRFLLLGLIGEFQPVGMQELFEGSKGQVKTTFSGTIEELILRDLVEADPEGKLVLTEKGKRVVKPFTAMRRVAERESS